MNELNEQNLIENTSIEIFQSLKYESANCFDEKFGTLSTLGRENSSEVVIIPKLTYALIKINHDVPIEVIDLAIDELTKDRRTRDLLLPKLMSGEVEV